MSAGSVIRFASSPLLCDSGAEEVRVVAGDAVEGGGLLVGEGQGLGGGVVAVGSEVVDHSRVRVADALRPELLLDVIGRTAQIVGGVVGAQVGPVPDHGSVFVQAACLVQLLAAGDVGAGEQHPARGGDHLVGHRHGRCICAVRQDAHHEEAEDEHQGHGLYPPFTDHGLR